MKITKKLIERVRITGRMEHWKQALDYADQHGYVVTQLSPRILRSEGRIDGSRFVLVGERTAKRTNAPTHQNSRKSA